MPAAAVKVTMAGLPPLCWCSSCCGGPILLEQLLLLRPNPSLTLLAACLCHERCSEMFTSASSGLRGEEQLELLAWAGQPCPCNATLSAP